MTTEDDLTFERSVNDRYLEALDRKMSFRPVISEHRSTDWTKVGAAKMPTIVRQPLAGRIGLSEADEHLGTSFYIGPRRISEDALEVISWDCQAAKRFYRVEESEEHRIVVRRTLLAQHDDIRHVSDEWVSGPVSPSPFHASSKLAVPAAPVRRRTPPAAPIEPMPAAPPKVSAPSTDLPHEPVEPAKFDRQREKIISGMRAVEAVEAAVQNPKSSSLTSMLSTLQPDQYELVTFPIDDQLIVQGHPGTGKTVVAVHRAAFLVSEERGAQRAQRVLFVGPTPEHAQHVLPLIRSFDPEARIEVNDILTVMQRLAGVTNPAVGPLEISHQDVAWAAGEFVIQARAILKGRGEKPSTQSLYETARSLGPQAHDPAWRTWLHNLPPFDLAKRKARLLPFLAFCGVTAQPFGSGGLSHMIVDEAQDVRPLEWRVLDRLNVGQKWTLVGDMNQRRVDHGHGTWESLGSDLGLDDGISPVKPQVMQRGYRSTEQIMTFANKLLPRGERLSNCVQQGEKPVRIRLDKAHPSMGDLVLSQILRLTDIHTRGTVAVISTSPDTLRPALTKSGWRADSTTSRTWRSGERVVSLHDPVTSRGIEFDAVIVVEPADFPKNLGRSGPLYTSLTRANRELVIVHEKPMPDALRKA